MIPERNNYWLLDSVAGWKIAAGASTGVSFTPSDGDITLDPLPGSARFLEASLVRCIACPVALAADCKGRVFVMDAATARMTVLELGTSIATPLTALGGVGRELRHFRGPRSLTVLPSGAIAVADTGNQRVQLFSASPYVLLKVWDAPEVRIKPLAVASDPCGIVYLLDRRTRSVLRVTASGEWLQPIGAGLLSDPHEIAVGADRTIAVLDGAGANAAIAIFPPSGDAVRLTSVASPLSLAFDEAGNLYAGTANAIVAKLQPDSTHPDGWSLGGDGVSDVDGSIVKLVWVHGHGLIGILNSASPAIAPRLFSMDPAGAFQLTASFAIGPLNSNLETCPWHRIQVRGSVPEGTSLAISTSTSEDSKNWTPFIPCAVLTGDDLDCLVQSPPGQYIQITANLKSTGKVTPRIHALQVFFPRQSYLEYLPAVFQDNDESRLFLDRFLSIFQATFDNFDQFLDNLWQLFDPVATPPNVLPWLAAWIALPVDPTTTAGQQRLLLKSAFQTYLLRGTVAGLQKMIEDYTGILNVRILEHFRLRNWTFLPLSGGLQEGARLWSENFYGRLQLGATATVGSFQLTSAPAPASEPYHWGANQFSVMFPANPYTVAATSAQIQTVLNREQPAYTQSFLCPVFPRMRVGVQATLGVDAYVGKVDGMVLGKLASLSYDSVLARSKPALDAQALGVSLHPRLGESAKLL